MMFRSLGVFVLGFAVVVVPACSGAPDYCDSCKDSAYACQHSNGKVTCHDSLDKAENACSSDPGHHIGKCN